MKSVLLGLTVLIHAANAMAGEVDVVAVKAKLNASGSYRFDVTLRHADQGWDHYADKWEVLTVDGKLLVRRVLLHPHVNEQPFTRSLGGVKIPNGINSVIVRGHDKIHASGGMDMKVKLPGR